ncbi:MAG: UDP-N-acetylglucosamine--N-acetylmuramyl-(pentapeptide) pyrophosphoryl-undecaprenol N-acetylglucosamine transferase [Oscillospiraceae bacterium]
MKLIFTCGGTAGHINPALGVAGKLKSLLPDTEILFVGAEGMMETELVPREGFSIETVKISNISRSLSPAGLKHNLQTIKNVFGSTKKAREIIRSFQPDAVIGTGGYVCYPVIKAAHRLGVPTLVHESNAVPGLTTKMLAGLTDCVMVGFEEAKKNYPPKTNVVFTGTPVRPDFLSGLTPDQAKARLGLPAGEKLVLSVWGSLGSDHMNGVMADFIPLAAQRKDFRLIHSAGKRGYPRLSQAIQGKTAENTDVRAYIYDMPLVMAAADLILCRSGASTLGELTALGRPALLVPSPNVTNNHQEKNARVLADAGAAVLLTEGSFTAESLYETVCDLLRDEKRLRAMSAAMSAAGRRDSTDKICDMILTYAAGETPAR